MPQFNISTVALILLTLFLAIGLFCLCSKRFTTYLAEGLYISTSFATYLIIGFLIYSWGQLVPGFLLIFCVYSVLLLNLILPKTPFFGLFGIALLLYVGCISLTYAYDFGLLGYFFSIVLGYCFFLYLNSMGEIQKLSPLKKEALNFYKIFGVFKPFFIFLVYFLIGALVIYLFIYYIEDIVTCIFNLEEIVEGQPVYLGLLVAIINLIFISILFLLVEYYKYKKIIKLKIKTSVFIYNLSYNKLVLFFKKNPEALDDIFILLLNVLSFLKAIPLCFVAFAGLSVRLDSGLSLSVLYFLVMFITCVVCLPTVQTSVMKTYGLNSFRLLGWNGPEVIIMRVGGTGLGLAGTYMIGSYAYEVRKDYAALRQLKRDQSIHTAQCDYVDKLRLRDPYGYHYEKKYSYPPEPQIQREIKTFFFKGSVEHGPVSISASYTRSPAQDSLARIGIDPHDPNAKIGVASKENKK